MWENKHLPMVAGKDDLGDNLYSMSERREQILEELEIAHIYIEQLYNEIKDLKAEIAELKNN